MGKAFAAIPLAIAGKVEPSGDAAAKATGKEDGPMEEMVAVPPDLARILAKATAADWETIRKALKKGGSK